MTTSVEHQIKELVEAGNVDGLVDLRNRAAKAYYEGDIDPLMNDIEFDGLLRELEALGVEEVPGHGYVPDDAAGSLPKIVHQYKLQSLKKVHQISEIVAWKKPHPANAQLIQLKYDGNALDVVFDEAGKFLYAATRGDHTKGEDVSATVREMMDCGRMPDHIDANGHKGNTHIRGEVYISHPDFKALNELRESREERLYLNPRNGAAGLLRRSDKSLVKFLSFVAYDTNNYGDDEIEFLDGNGFVTPKDHYYKTVTTTAEIKAAIDEIGIKRFTEFPFDTDGVVIKLKATHEDRENIGATSSHPRWAVAYKYPEVPQPTVIRDVIWNHNRTGKLTPVAIFDEVVLSGDAKTTRATLANYDKFTFFGFRPGDPILVIRANGVIPFIVGLNPTLTRSEEPKFNAPTFMPSEEFPTHLSPTGKDLMAHVDAPPPLAAVIENSFKVLELKGAGISFIEEMIEAGRVEHFLDMLTITHDEIVELRGVELADGETSTSAANTVAAIQTAFTKPLWRWIAAIGMKFVATSKSPILETRYSTLDELAKATIPELSKLDKFSGDVHANTVVASSSVIQYWADRLRAEHGFEPKPEAVAEVKASTGTIDYNGKVIVVTGTFPTMKRKEVEQWVKDRGGKIGSGVSRSTDILIYGEKAGSNLGKAEALGTVTMVTGEEFEKEA